MSNASTEEPSIAWRSRYDDESLLARNTLEGIAQWFSFRQEKWSWDVTLSFSSWGLSMTCACLREGWKHTQMGKIEGLPMWWAESCPWRNLSRLPLFLVCCGAKLVWCISGIGNRQGIEVSPEERAIVASVSPMNAVGKTIALRIQWTFLAYDAVNSYTLGFPLSYHLYIVNCAFQYQGKIAKPVPLPKMAFTTHQLSGQAGKKHFQSGCEHTLYILVALSIVPPFPHAVSSLEEPE